MADLGGGIYMSRVDSDEFEPDDEVGGFTHTLFEDGDTMAGLWKPDPDVSSGYAGLVLPARGTIVVLAGSVRIEIENGPTLDLSIGDMASLPRGAVTTWHPSPEFKGGLGLFLGSESRRAQGERDDSVTDKAKTPGARTRRTETAGS